MPRYDLTIAIFNTIRYIVPSLIANNIDTDIAQCAASLTVSQLESWMTRLLASVRKKVGGIYQCVAA